MSVLTAARICPSTLPSMSRSSSPVISPLMVVLAPITHVPGRAWGAPGAADGGGGGAGRPGAGGSAGLFGSGGFPKMDMIPPQGMGDAKGATRKKLERATGLEPATPSLGSSYSTN